MNEIRGEEDPSPVHSSVGFKLNGGKGNIQRNSANNQKPPDMWSRCLRGAGIDAGAEGLGKNNKSPGTGVGCEKAGTEMRKGTPVCS